MLFARLLERIVREGTLVIIDAGGRTHRVTGTPEPTVVIRLHDRALNWKLALRPQLYLGEAYTDGTLTVEQGDVRDLLNICCRNITALENDPLQKAVGWLSRALRDLQQHNPIGLARRNVAHHYDLNGQLYDLFLDMDRQYSCAYFATGNDSLDLAQDNKKRHIAAKLCLAPGQRVLDIGSGWGGLALYLAKVAEVRMTGVTLSQEQHKVSGGRAAEAGLQDLVEFRLQDYREVTESFDRVVSVGMFEHVGARHYGEFFRKLKDLLAEDGVALLHSIGRMETPGNTNPWLRKYIFPGGYAPALSEVFAAVERAGLWVTDVEILRLHYAETLKEWNRRFQGNRDQVRKLYDERFCRMWEFYLAGCEASFRYMNQMVFQMQITRRQDAAPLTRDYITDWERQHAASGNLAR